MKRFASPGVLTALVAANVALAFALVAVSTPRNEARAIGGGASYALSVGQGIGLPQEIVYLVDAESGKAAAITVNFVTKKIEIQGSRDISKDINGRAGTPK